MPSWRDIKELPPLSSAAFSLFITTLANEPDCRKVTSTIPNTQITCSLGPQSLLVPYNPGVSRKKNSPKPHLAKVAVCTHFNRSPTTFQHPVRSQLAIIQLILQSYATKF